MNEHYDVITGVNGQGGVMHANGSFTPYVVGPPPWNAGSLHRLLNDGVIIGSGSINGMYTHLFSWPNPTTIVDLGFGSFDPVNLDYDTDRITRHGEIIHTRMEYANGPLYQILINPLGAFTVIPDSPFGRRDWASDRTASGIMTGRDGRALRRFADGSYDALPVGRETPFRISEGGTVAGATLMGGVRKLFTWKLDGTVTYFDYPGTPIGFGEDINGVTDDGHVFSDVQYSPFDWNSWVGTPTGQSVLARDFLGAPSSWQLVRVYDVLPNGTVFGMYTTDPSTPSSWQSYIAVPTVPEPASLIALSLGVITLVRRRRTR